MTTKDNDTEDVKTCCNCDTEITDGSEHQHDNDTYCEDCFDELFGTCEHCSNVVSQDNLNAVYVPELRLQRTRRGQHIEHWCDECTAHHASKCNECYDYFDANLVHSDEYTTICHTCFDNGDWVHCESCGNLTSEAYSRGDYYYCESCDPGDDDDDDEDGDYNGIHEYGYKPKPLFFPPDRANDRTTLYYGVELEVQMDNISRAAQHTLGTLGENHAYMKHDGSVNHGFEIVTHPHTLDEHRKLWPAWFDDLPKDVRSYESGACGLHIHVGKSALSTYLIGKLLVFMNADHNRTFVECIAQRTANSYCEIKNKKLTDARRTSYDRYEAVNLCPSATIEFRIFRGNVRRERFFKALEFVDALIHWAKDAPSSDLRYQDFVKWVRKNRKAYRVLDTYLVEKGYLPKPTVRQGTLLTVQQGEDQKELVCA